MLDTDAKKEWEAYVAHERARTEPLLARKGFALDGEQPQTIGERYLTRPIGGGRKVVFFGRRLSDEMRVVIKTSSEPLGIAELRQEQHARNMLARLKFSYQVFPLPLDLLFDPSQGILITEYIAQEKSFLSRPLKEQFGIALGAFKAQEAAQVTTAGHESAVAGYCIRPGEYEKISTYAQDIIEHLSDDEELRPKLAIALDKATELIRKNEEALDRYDGFLTHWDFIPQNFRIRSGQLYLLDHTSIRFGNKYEGWARFINFMTLYNPPLADALVEYVRLNRTEEELLSLKLMRAYRLVELIRYYASWLPQTAGDTRELARVRIKFWTDVLEAVLHDATVSSNTIEAYKMKRDALRSDEEKLRQKDLH